MNNGNLKTLEKNKNNAKVSVIIPFYNREDFLTESIESVLAQTYSNWELILINDGSIDGSATTAKRFVESYPQKVFLFSHQGAKNRGASSSRNLGIEKANGDFITFLDSDDVFNPKTLQQQVEAFNRNPEADVVCGTLGYWFSWAEDRVSKERDFVVDLGVQTDRTYDPPTLLIHNLRASGRKPGMGCVAIRKRLTDQIVLFEDDFVYVSEDQLFWAKLSLHAKIYIHEECLVKYRQHKTSSSAILVESGKMVSDWKKLLTWLEGYLRKQTIEDDRIWKALRSCQRENRLRGKYKRVLDAYRKVLPYHLRYKVRDIIIRWRS